MSPRRPRPSTRATNWRRSSERVGEPKAEIFDAHIQFLDDPQITDGVESAIEDGLPAAHAVRETFDGFVDQFEGMDGRMAERADDLRDVRDRLLYLLVDDEALAATAESGPEIREGPVETTDGIHVEVAANLGGTGELTPAVESGADGVGLFCA